VPPTRAKETAEQGYKGTLEKVTTAGAEVAERCSTFPRICTHFTMEVMTRDVAVLKPSLNLSALDNHLIKEKLTFNFLECIFWSNSKRKGRKLSARVSRQENVLLPARASG
jgi:hypothetical protein